MRIFALLTKPPQFCSKRLFLHDSTLMILWGAGISSLNITGVYILFSRFSARSVLTQTRTSFWNSVLFPFFKKKHLSKRSGPINPSANAALRGWRSPLLRQESWQSRRGSISRETQQQTSCRLIFFQINWVKKCPRAQNSCERNLGSRERWSVADVSLCVCVCVGARN